MSQLPPLNTIDIQSLQPADAAKLARVARQAYQPHYRHLWTDGGAWYMREQFNARRLREELSDPNALFYMALLDGRPVGFLKLNRDATIESLEGDFLELERIYLMKRATGRGVGKALVHFTLDYARELGKNGVFLKAMDTSDALGFYEKMGFATFSRYRLSYTLMEEELRGMVAMVQRLR